jgi:hypothetical protein
VEGQKVSHYVYEVSYIDSILPEIKDASSTKIYSSQPMTFEDAEDILKEQLDNNGIFVDWLKVIRLALVPGDRRRWWR